jgi:hypothetical protein
MCNTINVREHKVRQGRKKDTLRLKKLQEKLTPNDPPSPIGSEGQESVPEIVAQQWERAHQANIYDQFFPPQAPIARGFICGASYDHFSSMIYGHPLSYPPPPPPRAGSLVTFQVHLMVQLKLTVCHLLHLFLHHSHIVLQLRIKL